VPEHVELYFAGAEFSSFLFDQLQGTACVPSAPELLVDDDVVDSEPSSDA
jgi:hypothetical protein